MSIYIIGGLKRIQLRPEWTEQIQAEFPQITFTDSWVKVPFTVTVEAPTRGAAFWAIESYEGDNQQIIVKSRSEGWYSADVLQLANRALNHNYHGGPFTAAEQADPDVIITSLPADSTINVIRTARRRRNRLRRVLMAQQFCTSFPNLSFQTPIKGFSGLTRLTLMQPDISISFLTGTTRVRLHHSNLFNECVALTDTHRIQTLIDYAAHNEQQAMTEQIAAAQITVVTAHEEMTAPGGDTTF